MNVSDYCRYDATALAAIVRSGEVSPRELVVAAGKTANKVNPEINAIVELYADLPDSFDESKLGDGPFRGVPFLRKDIGADETGRLKECGSRMFKGNVCHEDSNLWQKFKHAGIVNIGRSAVPEFGILGHTESQLTGVTCNPWNTARSAGGSSGGAAAAVAAGIVPMAHGSDGGGSIRIPASFCGLVGLLPSRGRISTGPQRQDPMLGLVREFILSRSVRDSATMLDAVHGYVAGDPFAIAPPASTYASQLDSAATRPLRIALSDQPWTDAPVDSEVVAAVRQVAAVLEDMGHTVEARVPPLLFVELITAICEMFAFADAGLVEVAAQTGRPVSSDYLEPLTLSLIEYGTGMSSIDIIKMLDVLDQTRLTMGRFLDDFDLLLSPSMAQLPPPHPLWYQKADATHANLLAEDLSLNPFLGLFNVTGQPAISLPLAQSESNLPIGIQLGANFGREDLLLNVAAELERAMPWSQRRPAIHAANP
ncbi:MAG: amidase family protein [Woeseiaceae bacterium]|jgi:amidase